MPPLTIDVDLPPGVTITAYSRHGEGHGFEVSWPLPTHCRCDRCHREEAARLEFPEKVQVVPETRVAVKFTMTGLVLETVAEAAAETWPQTSVTVAETFPTPEAGRQMA